MTAQVTQVEKRCRIEGCKRPYRAKSYCNVHYREWRQGKYGKARFKICSKEECLGKRDAMGLCETHLNEWRSARGKGSEAAEAAAPPAAAEAVVAPAAPAEASTEAVKEAPAEPAGGDEEAKPEG
ncbi:MAG: hypothetical protein Q8R92_00350 [Deltaproteobacteria bacterium]|nr:hypothetical protein [Deltaproteobacteria bacterium]